ncbi:MAG: hypothetical protein P4L87_04585 [Formivibrio sp.]|nr:hypothetical protein [Formivibrio sp.]
MLRLPTDETTILAKYPRIAVRLPDCNSSRIASSGRPWRRIMKNGDW